MTYTIRENSITPDLEEGDAVLIMGYMYMTPQVYYDVMPVAPVFVQVVQGYGLPAIATHDAWDANV